MTAYSNKVLKTSISWLKYLFTSLFLVTLIYNLKLLNINKMSSHKKIYTLEERSENEISPLWRWLQIIFYLCYICLGILLSYYFSSAVYLFQSNCILQTRIDFYEDSSGKMTPNINLYNLHSTYKCHIVIYVPIIIIAFSGFFMVLFFMCGRGGAGNAAFKHAWHLVLPAMIFNFICFSLAIYVGWTYHQGMKYTLQNVALAFKLKTYDLTILQDLQFEEKKIGTEIFEYLLLTKYSLYAFVSFCGLSFFWITIRCLFNIDFVLVRTDVYIMQKQSIVNSRLIEGKALSESVSNDSLSDKEKKDRVFRVRFRSVIEKVSAGSTVKPTSDDNQKDKGTE